jgi:hypothetical protein
LLSWGDKTKRPLPPTALQTTATKNNYMLGRFRWGKGKISFTILPD